MICAQLYLTDEQHQMSVLMARREQTTKAKLIRKLIGLGLKRKNDS